MSQRFYFQFLEKAPHTLSPVAIISLACFQTKKGFRHNTVTHSGGIRGLRSILQTKAARFACYNLHLDRGISYLRIHEINQRATPNNFTPYKHSLLLYKLYNNKQFS